MPKLNKIAIEKRRLSNLKTARNRYYEENLAYSFKLVSDTLNKINEYKELIEVAEGASKWYQWKRRNELECFTHKLRWDLDLLLVRQPRLRALYFAYPKTKDAEGNTLEGVKAMVEYIAEEVDKNIKKYEKYLENLPK